MSQLPIDFHTAAGYLGVKRLLVCGSRTAKREHLPIIREELVCVPKNTVIVHGAQGVLQALSVTINGKKYPPKLTIVFGADKLAGEVAEELGLTVEKHPAAWKRRDGSFDPGAGFRRNLEMLQSGVDMVLAFWDGDSPGTAHTLKEARKKGIPCRIVGI